MIIKRVETKHALKAFYQIGREVYRDNVCHRSTEDDVMRLLIEGPTAFHRHASVIPCIMYEGTKVVGRCAFINDQKLADYVQVSFFEALPGLDGIVDCILEKSRSLFPQCRRVVIGLNGHLNYGAGILLNHFDEPPVFGLPYTPPYYPEYFKSLDRKTMISFRYTVRELLEFRKTIVSTVNLAGIRTRNLDMKKFNQEIAIYTHLNNASFNNHPYWAHREVEEDLEVFESLKGILKSEHLIFAEKNDRVIGFLLWFPDYNQLVKKGQKLGFWQILQYRFADPINTYRYAEIGVLPQYRVSPATLALILQKAHNLEHAEYAFGEGGFIFEENSSSMLMAQRFLQRVFGRRIRPYRRYALFESKL